MGAAGSVGASPLGVISLESLRESFKKNEEKLHLLFPSTQSLTTDEDITSEISQKWIDKMFTQEGLLHWLLNDVADGRRRELGEVDYLVNSSSENKEEFVDLFDLPDIVSLIEVNANELQEVGTNIASCNYSKYALSAECLGLSDLKFYDAAMAEENPFGNKAVAINLANNQLNDESYNSSTLSKSLSIVQLNVGGNALTYVPILPSNLLFLDLSYSEDLRFDSFGIFTACPQLLKLVLDGCGIRTTLCTGLKDHGELFPSIFFGLVKLRELSLKENMIECIEDLDGLLYFSRISLGPSISETAANVEAVSVIMLRNLVSLCMVDNPLLESTAGRKAVLEFVEQNVPSVSVLNGKTVGDNTKEGSVVDKSSASYKQRINVISDHDMITETMAQEYAAALKGERDNTVIS